MEFLLVLFALLTCTTMAGSGSGYTPLSGTSYTSTDPSSALPQGPMNYNIVTATNTTLEEFEAMIKNNELPQNGSRFYYNSYQMYTVTITYSKACEVAKDPHVTAMGVDRLGRPSEVFSEDSQIEDIFDKRAPGSQSRDPNLWRRDPAASYLSLLSRDNDHPIGRSYPGILYDPALGRGSTIYVIDSGYNIAHREFTTRGGAMRNWTIPNRLNGGTMPEDERDWTYDARSQTYIGHGNAIASLAGGATLSFAPNAELVSVKVVNGYSTPNGPRSTGFRAAAYRSGLQSILDDVRNGNRGRKSVVALTTSRSNIESVALPLKQSSLFSRLGRPCITSSRDHRRC